MDDFPSSQRRRGRPRNADVASELNVAELPDGPSDIEGLTMRQRQILEVIRDSIDRNGYPPSVREIGNAAGLASPSSVAHQLKSLEARGFLRRAPNRPRALEVMLPESQWLLVEIATINILVTLLISPESMTPSLPQ